MTPEERIAWCLEQAEALEAKLPPFDEDGTNLIGHYVARALRRMASAIQPDSGEGRA